MNYEIDYILEYGLDCVKVFITPRISAAVFNSDETRKTMLW